MWRYGVGVVAGALLAVGGVLWWKGPAVAERGRSSAAATVAAGTDDAIPEPPAASDRTREEKRFSRYDKDRNGTVAREEYLAARRKAFAKLDLNGDGRLTFDEWAIKAETKFAAADTDKSGLLTPTEFATTRVARKPKPRVNCAPTETKREEEES